MTMSPPFIQSSQNFNLMATAHIGTGNSSTGGSVDEISQNKVQALERKYSNYSEVRIENELLNYVDKY